MEIEGRYQKGRASVDEFLEQVAIANPHVRLVYKAPDGETREFPRTIEELPPQPKEIKPHPYGIEFGVLLRMLHDTRSHWLTGFLSGDFSRVSPALAQEICKTAKLSRNARPRNIHGADGGGALQGHPGHEDHGAAVQLHLAHRREGDPPRPLQADQGRVLHRRHAPARRLPRQPLRDRGGHGLRPGAGAGRQGRRRRGGARGAAGRGRAGGRRQRAGARHPLRQPRAAALPAVRLRHLQGRARDRVEELRRVSVPRGAPRRAHGDLRPHGERVGAVHQRVEGSHRRLRRDPQGDQARAPGVRPPPRRLPPPPRARQERVPPAQHLRALHRGGGGGLRPAQGRPAAEGTAQGAAPEDRP